MNELKREDIIRVIERKGAAERVPLAFDFWIGANVFGNDIQKRAEWFAQYPCDIKQEYLPLPGMTEGPEEDPDFYWAAPGAKNTGGKGLDAQCLIPDWEEAEAFFSHFPSPDSPALMPKKIEKDDRYLLSNWNNCFFERLWSLRGMENALMDFYLYPDEIHHLFEKLTEFYIRAMERIKEEADVDGFFMTDDIGTQKAPFFSLDIFREFFKPYYKRLIDKAHELGTHFWLHSCGNIEIFIPELIDIGLDVLHPIQKNTMDEREIARKYGDRICIWAGIDVQRLMAFGTPDEVRSEVRFLLDTYWRPEGGLMLTMGNGSTEDWKMENMEALYEAALEWRRQ